ncbi:MAG TPA: PASTA domain-containing protein [Bacteroidales bacterium]|nr:PASTA domain-containing protein [Bacteroidales bacterium]HPF02669.1 PASTA domain-containing protein [Bacteroidales bacterium]HPJ60504.1 PASTA domain-containing protein [Bacteroidales bacterium]HPR13427.1 PASTA domain-containing protein [Bacteroidales bacterium]HRW84976.1 PASTA domain-containing protein [Bacteroidales bacterium]
MSLKDFILSRLFLKHLGLAVLITAGVTLITLLFLNIYTRHGQSRAVPDFYGLSIEETEALARKSKMKYVFADSVYTSVVPRGCVAEQNPKPGFKVKKWRKISLTINAFRPEMVAMPDLINLPLRQANALIESSGLVVGKKTYKPDLSIDVVLNQLHDGKEISPDDSLQKGSVIDLVLGKGFSSQLTFVPDLTGMSFEEAKDRINGTSLNLGAYNFDNTINTEQDSLNAFVYKQSPEYRENATMHYGASMYLWFTIDSLKLPSDSTLVFPGDTILPADVLI